jgi:predicted component of type VI protein secretion system
MKRENNFSLEDFVQRHMSNLVFNTIELEDREERRLPNVCQ